MKKLTTLCLLLISSILGGHSNGNRILTDEKERYAINADGDAYFTQELSTTLSFTEICTKITEVISDNFVNAGAGISLNNQKNLFVANYIFPDVQRDFPLVLDAWSILKVELKDERVYLTLTLTNYSKKTRAYQKYIRISEVQPLNPNGKKQGFRSQKKLIDAFNNPCAKAASLIRKFEQSFDNQ